jgi:Ca2+-binding EF-hand superfamily protein
VGIEDVIKPMATKLRKFEINFGLVFDKFDSNKNNRLSANELADAIQIHQQTDLKDEEIEILRVFFKNKFNLNGQGEPQINRSQFVSLMETKFENKFDK